MPTTLSTIRTAVRRDLHDEDSANYRWTDTVLDRHIDRAVREFSLTVPREETVALTTTAGSRDLSLASVSGLIAVDGVEYPVSLYPRSYVRFSIWGTTLTLLIEGAPAGAESVAVYVSKVHTLDGTGSTIPTPLEDLVVTGAAAYAALEWASFATNRVNVGGAEVWRQYLVWGQERLAAFARELARNGRRSAVRVRRLYQPALAGASRTTDWGP